jgi:hypothetical protein
MNTQILPYTIPPKRPAYLDQNLVLWFAFYSTNAKDYSRFGNHGSILGPVWARDRFGACLSFDGVDDSVEAVHSSSLDLNAEVSIETWFNIRKYYIVNSQALVDKYDHTKAGYILGIDSFFSNKLHFSLTSFNDVLVTKTILSDYTLPLTTLFHVVALKDSQGMMQMYINGIKQSQTERFNYPYSINIPLKIGKYANRRFDGLISEVRIYNRALTVNEIRRRFRGEI